MAEPVHFLQLDRAGPRRPAPPFAEASRSSRAIRWRQAEFRERLYRTVVPESLRRSAGETPLRLRAVLGSFLPDARQQHARHPVSAKGVASTLCNRWAAAHYPPTNSASRGRGMTYFALPSSSPRKFGIELLRGPGEGCPCIRDDAGC